MVYEITSTRSWRNVADNEKDYATPSDACHDNHGTTRFPSPMVYCAIWHLGGLYPAADPLKAALVDQVVLHIDDMNMAIFPSIIERDNNKKTLLRKEIVESSSEMLSGLDKVLENTVLANGRLETPSLLLISVFTC
ncbi:hypothetical protein BASA83_003015 [Batrachochytrium salamandrivorans]|nr:hypothetical protein BASA83_003015 [Batrachochytrium salamandrivorans]